MKILRLCLFFFLILLFSNLSYSQSYNSVYHGFLQELYFERQPSPKAQSMGGGLAAYTENEFGSYYNPALTSLSEGLTVNTSFSKNYKNYTDAKFNFLSVSYKVKNIGSFGLSRNYLNYKLYSAIESYHSIYTLNYSKEIFKDFYAGININALTPHFTGQDEPLQVAGTTYPIDIGILGKIHIADSSPDISQLIQIGSSLYNLNRVRYDNGIHYGSIEYYPLPEILRLAMSYNIKIKKDNFLKSPEIFSFLGHFELEWVPNSDLYSGIKFGSEIIFLDILSLRTGYYIGDTKTVASVSDFTPLTYGTGVKIPIDRIFRFKTPLSVSIDYVHLNQQPESNLSMNYDVYEYYKTISVKLNYTPNF